MCNWTTKRVYTLFVFIYNLNMEVVIIIIFLLLVVTLIIYVVYDWMQKHENWKDQAKREEKELRQSLLIVKSINQFNHWIFKYDDEEFIKHYRNDYSGSVSNDRLASLKLYDQFIDLGDSFFNIKNGVFNLPTSFFSKVSMEAKREIEKIEMQKKLLLEALKRKHVSSTEVILTVRNTMKKYYNLLAVPLSEIANLEMQTIYSENEESQSIIKQEKHRIEVIKSVRMSEKTTETVFGWSKSKTKRKNKESVKLSKQRIKEEKRKISKRNQDLKLRKYLINHGDIQKTAREYLKYLQDVKRPLTEIELGNKLLSN